MPVVWSDRCLLHDPAAEIWVGVAGPAAETPARATAIREALDDFHGRWRKGDLPDVELSDEWRRRLSRRTRVEEMAELLEEVTAS